MRIVMDDAGDLPDDLICKYNIKVVPINITFGTEEYPTGISVASNLGPGALGLVAIPE